VGAVSRRSVLRLPTSAQDLFDVEQFRSEPRRIAVSREVPAATLVLGSTQPTELVGQTAMRERGVELVRRRGGGGAVYLEPGDPLWVDVWIPRDDPLWRHDVAAAAEWVGAWWLDVLAGFGLSGFDVHTGRSVPGELGELVCFAGRGPGEVFRGGRKVVGLSQWRAREGALFSSCAYLRWDPAPLLALVHLEERVRDELTRLLVSSAVGLADLHPPVTGLDVVRARLLETISAFGT
jgi:lipoate-protein ligase A